MNSIFNVVQDSITTERRNKFNDASTSKFIFGLFFLEVIVFPQLHMPSTVFWRARNTFLDKTIVHIKKKLLLDKGPRQNLC